MVGLDLRRIFPGESEELYAGTKKPRSEFLPCPKCGSDKIILYQEIEGDHNCAEHYVYTVCCRGCRKVHGASGYSIKGAVENWNLQKNNIY